MALAVPLSRFTSRVGGGSAFFVRQHYAFMSYIADTLLFLLGIALYSSGLLLWPIRRWLCRRQKVRGRALWFVFLIQAAALPVFIFMTLTNRSGPNPNIPAGVAPMQSRIVRLDDHQMVEEMDGITNISSR